MPDRAQRFSMGMVAAAAIAAPSALASAEQFTLFDFTYEATTQNTHDAHYDVRSPMYPLPQPDNWRMPIDYTMGTIYIEQDVLTKPSMEDTQVDICFLTGGYGCLNTKHYFTTGRNQTVKLVRSFWQFNNINWNRRIPLVQLIVKDKNNANGGRPVSSYMPTKMRIALTVVSPGGSYTPPPGFAALPAPDGGAADGGGSSDAGGSADAGAGADAATGTDPQPGADAGAPPPPVTTPPAVPPGPPPPSGGGGMPPPSTPPPTTPPRSTPPAPAPADAKASGSALGCSLAGARSEPLGVFALLAVGLAAGAVRRRRPRAP